ASTASRPPAQTRRRSASASGWRSPTTPCSGPAGGTSGCRSSPRRARRGGCRTRPCAPRPPRARRPLRRRSPPRACSGSAAPAPCARPRRTRTPTTTAALPQVLRLRQRPDHVDAEELVEEAARRRDVVAFERAVREQLGIDQRGGRHGGSPPELRRVGVDLVALLAQRGVDELRRAVLDL